MKVKIIGILLVLPVILSSCITYTRDDMEIVIDSDGTHITTPEFRYDTPEKIPEPDSEALDDAIESIKE